MRRFLEELAIGAGILLLSGALIGCASQRSGESLEDFLARSSGDCVTNEYLPGFDRGTICGAEDAACEYEGDEFETVYGECKTYTKYQQRYANCACDEDA